MNIALAKTGSGRAVENIFTAARDRLPGTGKVADVRQQAFDAFERAGLPHRRLEDWKYTDLRALMREVLPLAAEPDASALKRAEKALASLKAADACLMVLVVGCTLAQVDMGTYGAVHRFMNCFLVWWHVPGTGRKTSSNISLATKA